MFLWNEVRAPREEIYIFFWKCLGKASFTVLEGENLDSGEYCISTEEMFTIVRYFPPGEFPSVTRRKSGRPLSA